MILKALHAVKTGNTKLFKSDIIDWSSDTEKYQIPFRSIIPFLLISFGLAWGILALFIFLPEQMTGVFGQLTGQHPANCNF